MPLGIVVNRTMYVCCITIAMLLGIVTVYSILMLLYLIRTMLTALLPCQYVPRELQLRHNGL